MKKPRPNWRIGQNSFSKQRVCWIKRAKQDVKAEQVLVANRLNAKEINPLFKVAGEYQQGTGKGYFVRGDLK